jgi:hypothetical protein
VRNLVETILDQTRFPYYLLQAVLIGLLIGFFVVQNNPFFLFIAFFLSIRVFLFIKPNTSIYVILFSVFFLDWLRDLNLISDQFTLLPDVILVVLMLKVLLILFRDKKVIRTPLDIPVILYILFGILSGLINGQHPVTTFVGFRFDLKYALLFYLMVQLNLPERFLKRIFGVFMFLLLIQVPVAVIKSFKYGQGEEAIGTYAYHTGILSTVLPLIAISIFVGLYFFHKPRFIYIVGCLLFFLFSIIGGKRGFIFFAVALSLYLGWQAGLKNLAKTAVVAPFFFMGFLATVYFVPELRPAIEDPVHLVSFTVSYETMHSKEDGAAAGRTAALMKSNEILRQNAFNLFLGFGPGSISQSFFQKYKGRLEDKIPIVYGRSQLVTMSLEEGYIGVLLFLLCIIPFLKISTRVFMGVEDPFWKAMAFAFKGIVFTYLICMNYGVIFRMDVSGFIFWFFAAMVFTVGKQRKLL